MDNGALPPNPARNRNAINWSLFWANAQPKFHAINLRERRVVVTKEWELTKKP